MGLSDQASPYQDYRLWMDSKRLVRAYIPSSVASEARRRPHTTHPQSPQCHTPFPFGQRGLPDRGLVPCLWLLQTRATVSASVSVLLALAGSLQHRRFPPTLKVQARGCSPQWGLPTLLGPQWVLCRVVGGRCWPSWEPPPDPQIGGPGPRTKGRRVSRLAGGQEAGEW